MPRRHGDAERRTVSAGLRSARERVIQTLAFETGGLLLVAPLYALASGSGAAASFGLVAALAVAVMVWAALFNTVFDLIEHRLCGRVASARPHRLRLLHALLHEASAAAVTWPLIVALTDLSWAQALVADLGLTLAYAGYAYFFHLGYDRLRPVVPASSREAARAAATCWPK
jgi:uncharacterized membrane protein